MFDCNKALQEFGQYHQRRANRVAHDFGISLISMAFLGVLSRWEWPVPGLPLHLDLALVVIAIVLPFDFRFSTLIAIGTLAGSLVAYGISTLLPTQMLAGLFVLGIGCQLVGHWAFEKNQPAFREHIHHLYVGPRRMISRWLKAFRLS
jgi:uncharacterized membrane protein YGL010W